MKFAVLACVLAMAALAVPALAASPSHVKKPHAPAKPVATLHRDAPPLSKSAAAPSMPSGFTPAPTPNVDLYAPPERTAQVEPSWGPGVAPDQHQVAHPGAGWTSGSAYSDNVEQHHSENPLGFTPTWNLKVPLQ